MRPFSRTADSSEPNRDASMVDIDHSARLTDLFGHWPHFHDAELRALRLEAPRGGGPWMEADIEVAEMSAEVDERGYYRDRQRALTTIRFDNVLDVAVFDFRFQNVLNALEIRETTPEERHAGPAWGSRRYHVAFLPIPGFCEVAFFCDAIEVLSAIPVARAT